MQIERHRSATARVAIAGLLGMMLAGSAAHADDAYGTNDYTVTTILSSAFAPRVSTQGWVDDINGYRSATGSPAPFPFAIFRAGMSLPSGVWLDSVVLDACDDDPAGVLTLTVFECAQAPPPNPGTCFPITGTATGSGCMRYATGPIGTVNNANFTYMIEVWDNDATTATRFRGVHLVWRRQVSPAPAQATFGDVPPSHFAFRFVEALAASGITGGCGGGQYCPDAPLTRAQMAVFLATALGLHWPN